MPWVNGLELKECIRPGWLNALWFQIHVHSRLTVHLGYLEFLDQIGVSPQEPKPTFCHLISLLGATLCNHQVIKNVF